MQNHHILNQNRATLNKGTLNLVKLNTAQPPDNTPETVQTEPPKKKPRLVKEWQKVKAKLKRNAGEEYIDRSGKVHAVRKLKDLVDHNVNCRYNCHENIPEETRKELFEDFWKLGDYNLQTSFLYNSITVTDPVRRNGDGVRSRNVSTQFRLARHRVCKYFLVKTLDVSNKRVDTVILKKRNDNGTGVSPKDMRSTRKPRKFGRKGKG